MTLSKDQRIEDMARALVLMLERIGDRAIDAEEASVTEPPFDVVNQTTWIELRTRGWIRRFEVMGREAYFLTGSGWIRALEITGAVSDSGFDKNIGQLMAALKGLIEGRQAEASEHTDIVAQLARLSTDWIFNVIESNIIEQRYGRKGAHWDGHYPRGKAIRVPIDFGQAFL